MQGGVWERIIMPQIALMQDKDSGNNQINKATCILDIRWPENEMNTPTCMRYDSLSISPMSEQAYNSILLQILQISTRRHSTDKLY